MDRDKLISVVLPELKEFGIAFALPLFGYGVIAWIVVGLCYLQGTLPH